MFTLNCNGRLLVIDSPVVMGIINLTPDSFYKGSRFNDPDDVYAQAEQMQRDGATILDIGGQSSRPGSKRITADEEIQRVLPVIEGLAKRFPELYISIDTYYASVAKRSVEAGASIVNDISAGKLDPQLIPVVATLNVPYVLMHMQGEPGTMQTAPVYIDVVVEVLQFLIQKKAAIHAAGVRDVIIDPGFGFGKTIVHNFALLNKLGLFSMLQSPILLGVSRKSSIAKILGVTTEETLNGTTVMNTIGLMNGASILRVHDVKQAVEAIRLVNEFRNPK